MTDADLDRLPVLYKLRGIGLRGTKVTHQGLKYLLKFPRLEKIHLDHGDLTREKLQAMTASPE